MKLKATLKHYSADCEGCFNLYDENNHYVGAISVSDADALAASINIQIMAAIQEQDERRRIAEEELADNARREALNGAAQ